MQTAVILAGDTVATALTAASVARSELKPLAQAFAATQLRAHMLSQGREFFRPTINTVHVGDPQGGTAMPPDGRNLRPEDLSIGTSAAFGAATGALEFGSQVAMKYTLNHQSAWEARSGLAIGAALVAGVANTVSSSVEDHLIDHAAARRMQEVDPTHVTHIRWEFKNPLTVKELSRQFERVDARVFNQMLPAMLASAAMYGLNQLLDKDDMSDAAHALTQAAISALLAGIVGGLLLTKTVQSYQLNDTLREYRARARVS